MVSDLDSKAIQSAGMTTATTYVRSDYRPPVCPECGYSLEGHGVEGNCPECGFHYGPEQIVIFGRAKVMPSFVVAFAFLGTMGLFLLIIGCLLHSWGIALLGFSQVFNFAIQWWRWRPPHQLRLSANGYGARSRIGYVHVQPWKSNTRFWMDVVDERHTRISIEQGLFIRSDIILNVEINPETARWIETQVRGWIRASSEKAGEKHAQA
jgi:hypothetical protein